MYLIEYIIKLICYRGHNIGEATISTCGTTLVNYSQTGELPKVVTNYRR